MTSNSSGSNRSSNRSRIYSSGDVHVTYSTSNDTNSISSIRMYSSPVKSRHYVQPSDVKRIFQNANKTASSSIIRTNSIEYIKDELPQLFNLSIENCIEISESKKCFDTVLNLLNIDKTDKEMIDRIKKFIKYIGPIQDKDLKNPHELSSLIKTKQRKTQIKDLNSDILNIVLSRYNEIVVPTLLDWIDIKNIDWRGLSSNQSDGAIELLKQNPDKIVWSLIRVKTASPRAIALFKLYPDKIDWDELSKNENNDAIKLLKDNLEKINWNNLSKNPNGEAIKLLKANREKINWQILQENENDEAIKLVMERPRHVDYNWENLSKNTCDEAIKLLKENPDKVVWELFLSQNKRRMELVREYHDKIDLTKYNLRKYLALDPSDEAIELLEKIKGKINWFDLSYNINPKAVQILKKYPKKIYWGILSGSQNPEAIKLLKNNPDKIKWRQLSSNENEEAMELLKEHTDKIRWIHLSSNKTNGAIQILKQNQNRIYVEYLCENQNKGAMDILKGINEKYPDKISWSSLSENPSIFQTR